MNKSIYNEQVKSICGLIAEDLLWGYDDVEGANMYKSIETVGELEQVIRENGGDVDGLIELDLFDEDEEKLLKSLVIFNN